MVQKGKKALTGAAAVLLTLTAAAGCSNTDAPSGSKPSDSGAGNDFGKIVLVQKAIYNKSGVQKVADYIKKESGVSIESVYADDTPTKFNLMITSKEPVDAILLDRNNYLKALNKGLLMPLDEFLDKYGPTIKQKVNPNLWKWSKGSDGKIYGIPSESIASPYTPMIRTDWLKAVNLPLPKTIGEFEQALQAIKKASPSKKQNQELYPLFIGPTQTDEAFLGAFLPKGMSWWKNADNTYLPPEMAPEYKTYLETLQRWYKEKLIHPESFIVMSKGKLNDFVTQDLVAATAGWYSQPFVGEFDKLLALAPDANYDAAPLSGSFDNGLMKIEVPNNMMAISATSKNPESVVRIVEWIAKTRENMIVSRIGLPGMMYEYSNKDKYEIKTLAAPDPNAAFTPGTFEFLDFQPQPDTTEVNTNNPRTLLYYKTWKTLSPVKKYATLDTELALDEAGLASTVKYKATLDTAKQEQFIRIVTGEKPVSDWDAFLAGWRKMGMDEIIKEKNELYRKAGK
ncbi:extracellular solute-binding protein [Paenibacillus sp. MBLB4367]|uniref:extracellular solute-binding protein n=1 Tax=Paenibacillus sp. MBLB4367 TaxID=3384767 RepID=UPI00390806CF